MKLQRLIVTWLLSSSVSAVWAASGAAVGTGTAASTPTAAAATSTTTNANHPANSKAQRKPAPSAPAVTAAPAARSSDPAAQAAGEEDDADSAPLPPPSSAAQHLYGAARNDLLQVRTLLKSGRTQSSVGSGFLIGTSNLVITNYHVVSQFALDPDTYVGEWVDTSGQRGNVELLAVDVLHDLAVLRVNRNGTGFFKMPEQLARLTQGQYLYSMGNPLDLGFA